MYTVFTYPVSTTYKSTLCSKVTVFFIVITALSYVLPLLIAYRSQGFWQKVDTYEEQPDVHFEHEIIVLLETADPDQSFGWSTMANFNALLDERLAIKPCHLLAHPYSFRKKNSTYTFFHDTVIRGLGVLTSLIGYHLLRC